MVSEVQLKAATRKSYERRAIPKVLSVLGLMIMVIPLAGASCPTQGAWRITITRRPMQVADRCDIECRPDPLLFAQLNTLTCRGVWTVNGANISDQDDYYQVEFFNCIGIMTFLADSKHNGVYIQCVNEFQMADGSVYTCTSLPVLFQWKEVEGLTSTQVPEETTESSVEPTRTTDEERVNSGGNSVNITNSMAERDINIAQVERRINVIVPTSVVVLMVLVLLVLSILLLVYLYRDYKKKKMYNIRPENESGLPLKGVEDEPEGEVVSEGTHDEALDDVVVVTDSIKVNRDNNIEQAEADEPEGKDSKEKNDQVMPDQVLLEDDDKNDVRTEEGQPDVETEYEDKDIQVVLPATETIMENVEKNSEHLVKEQLPVLEAEEQEVKDLVKEQLPVLEAEEQEVKDLVKEQLPVLEAEEQQVLDLVKEQVPVLEAEEQAEEQQVQDLVKEQVPMLEAEEQAEEQQNPDESSIVSKGDELFAAALSSDDLTKPKLLADDKLFRRHEIPKNDSHRFTESDDIIMVAPMDQTRSRIVAELGKIENVRSSAREEAKESAKDENQPTSEATGDVHHGSSAGGVTPLPTCDGDIFTTSAISHMIQERGDIKGFNANMQ